MWLLHVAAAIRGWPCCRAGRSGPGRSRRAARRSARAHRRSGTARRYAIADRRQVGDLAVVLVGADIEQRARSRPACSCRCSGRRPARGRGRGVGDVALAAAGDLGRIVQEGDAEQVVVASAPSVPLTKPCFCVLSTVRRNTLVSSAMTSSSRFEVAEAAEEPGLVAHDRAADRERGVVASRTLASGLCSFSATRLLFWKK